MVHSTNTVLQHILSCKEAEKRQREGLERHAGIRLEPVRQGAGVVGDCRVVESVNPLYPYGLVLEMKDDRASARTGNFYLETQYTRDYWTSSVQSGVAKACQKGCAIVLQSGVHNYVIPANVGLEILERGGRFVSTREGVNGNYSGQFTRGLLVPLNTVKRLAVDSFCA